MPAIATYYSIRDFTIPGFSIIETKYPVMICLNHFLTIRFVKEIITQINRARNCSYRFSFLGIIVYKILDIDTQPKAATFEGNGEKFIVYDSGESTNVTPEKSYRGCAAREIIRGKKNFIREETNCNFCHRKIAVSRLY